MIIVLCLISIMLISVNALASLKLLDKSPLPEKREQKSNEHTFSLGLVDTIGRAGGSYGGTGWPKISGKYWIGGRSALDFAVLYTGEPSLFLGFDYLLHFSNQIAKNTITPYVGIGGILILGTTTTTTTLSTYPTLVSFQNNTPVISTISDTKSAWNYVLRLPIGLDIGIPILGSSLSFEVVPLYGPATSSFFFNIDLAFRYYL